MVVFLWFYLLQLDNVDEQAAQIRRELDGRLQLAERIARVRRGGCVLLYTTL